MQRLNHYNRSKIRKQTIPLIGQSQLILKVFSVLKKVNLKILKIVEALLLQQEKHPIMELMARVNKNIIMMTRIKIRTKIWKSAPLFQK